MEWEGASASFLKFEVERGGEGWVGSGEYGCAPGLVIVIVRCLRQHDDNLLNRMGM